MKAQQELLNFLIDEAGGEDLVYLKFYKSKIGDLATEKKSLKDLRQLAKDEGWSEWLETIRLTDLAKAIVPPVEIVASTPHSPVASRRSGGRMTAAQRDKLYQNVLEFVGDHPWCSSSEISNAVGFDTRKLGIHLKKMRDTGKLKSTGERSSMRYAVNNESPSNSGSTAEAIKPIRRKRVEQS